MNKLISFCLSLLTVFVFVSSSFSQASIEKYFVNFEISNIETGDGIEGMEMISSLMENSTMEIYTNGKKTITRNKIMNDMLENTIVIDHISGGQIMLVDFPMMGQKMKIDIPKDSIDRNNEIDINEQYDIKIDKESKVEILGYECYKIVATHKMNTQMKFEFFITEQIPANSQAFQQFKDLKINGFPLQFTIGSKEMSITYKAKEFSKDIDDSDMDINFSGYENVTFEEFQERMGGMGGFGF